jgi:hypothetical protein
VTLDADLFLTLAVDIDDLQVLTQKTARTRGSFAVFDTVAALRIHQRQTDQYRCSVELRRHFGKIARRWQPIRCFRIDISSVGQPRSERSQLQAADRERVRIESNVGHTPRVRTCNACHALVSKPVPHGLLLKVLRGHENPLSPQRSRNLHHAC